MKKRIVYFVMVGVVATIIVGVMFLDDGISDDPSNDSDADSSSDTRPTVDLVSIVDANQDIWDSYDISNYAMSIHMFAPPVVPIGVDLTIENGRITNSSIIACDNPTEQHPERQCETTRTYYADLGHYTISELFARAEQCMRATEEVLNSCTAFDTNGFDGFSDLEEMGAATDLCKPEMRTKAVCLVEFHEDYGYPLWISSRNPNIMDGGSDLWVEDFEILD